MIICVSGHKGASIYDVRKMFGFLDTPPPPFVKFYILFVRKIWVLSDPPSVRTSDIEAPLHLGQTALYFDHASLYSHLCPELLFMHSKQEERGAPERAGDGASDDPAASPGAPPASVCHTVPHPQSQNA